MLLARRTFSVNESARDVRTGFSIADGDRIVINAQGEIWAGVWFTGNNDANGWVNHHAGANSPLPGSPPFSLLAKVGSGNFFLAGRLFDRTFRGTGGELILRINDDAPGNGNGAFSVTVEHHRPDAPPVTNRTITVRESDRDVRTGITIQTNDRVVINSQGFIWAGVWFTGENGPEGWPGHIQNNSNAPLRGVPPYALLAKIGTGPYMFVGRLLNHIHTGAAGELILRINDDTPGNGNGQFNCGVEVLREPPPVVIPFTGTGTLRFNNPDSQIAGPHSGAISGRLRFNGTRIQVEIIEFTPISVSFDTPLGRNTTTVSLERSDRGIFSPVNGSMEISIGVLLTNSIGLAGSSRMQFVMTTGNSRNAAFNMTGAALNRANRSLKLTGTSVVRGGYIDGNLCALELDVVLNTNP